MTLPATRVLAALTQQPWFIQPSFLDVMIGIAERQNEFDPGVLQKRWGEPQAGARRTVRRDSVAVVPVHGPLIKYADMFSEISGATSYSTLAKDLETAKNDPEVSHIILDVDSPGGMANGCQELAAMIRDANEVKPVIAYAGGTAASAAYWLASAAGRVVAGPTAMIGSIGVVVSGMDTRGIYEKAGAKFFKIVSSQSPRKQPDPTNEEGHAQIQSLVDDLAEQFISAVASYRGVTEAKVLKSFGKGDVMLADAAMKAGMIDSIGSLEGLIAECLSETDQPKAGGLAAAANSDTEVQMNLSELKDKDPQGYAALMQEAAQSIQTKVDKDLQTKDALIASLQEENGRLVTASQAQESRLVALERESVMRAEREITSNASAIMAAHLSSASLPERVKSKIRVDHNPHVKDGVLDVESYTAAVAKEVQEWEAAVGESYTPVMGGTGLSGGIQGKTVDTQAKPGMDTETIDKEVGRWAKLAGVDLKEGE